jgi:hypothetical protein
MCNAAVYSTAFHSTRSEPRLMWTVAVAGGKILWVMSFEALSPPVAEKT